MKTECIDKTLKLNKGIIVISDLSELKKNILEC